MTRRFDGRVALVTGASRGIGEAIARRLAAEGASVVVHASPRSEPALVAVADAIRGAGGIAVPLVADLTDERLVETLAAAAGRSFGPVDMLINNYRIN